MAKPVLGAKSPRVAIIGAGCSGITAIKCLAEAGITEMVCYEQNSRIGGNWIYSEKPSHSSVCETTHIISSKKLSAFSDFPMPDHYPDYPSHEQLLAYFDAYAEHFGVLPYIRFNSKVEKAEPVDGGRWKIETSGGQTELFDYLLVSNGHHSVPRHPELPGKFTGEYMHAHAFKNNRKFHDKRVLVIGAGNSGCDCAVECSRVAARTAISVRRPHYIVPKFFMGKPTDEFNARFHWLPQIIANPLRKFSLQLLIGKYKAYGLPEPDFPITSDHPTLNSELLYMIRHGKVLPRTGIIKIEEKKVTFSDGLTEEYDVIIAATGYKIATPFLNPDLVDYADADRIELYLRMFHPKIHNLIFIGLVQPQGAIWPLSEAQSKLTAKLITSDWKLPANINELAKKEADSIQKQFLQKKRHTIEVHYHQYLKTLQTA